jgi:hypothetical protein
VKQGLGDPAREEIGFVALGDGDDHVRLGTAGTAQRGRMRGVAADDADIEALLQLVQRHTVAVDDGDVVGLDGEVLGQCRADLPGPEDHDFHVRPTLRGSLGGCKQAVVRIIARGVAWQGGVERPALPP